MSAKSLMRKAGFEPASPKAPDPKSRTEGEQSPQQGLTGTHFGHRQAPKGTDGRVPCNIARNIAAL